jgi:hypothetical protein
MVVPVSALVIRTGYDTKEPLPTAYPDPVNSQKPLVVTALT